MTKQPCLPETSPPDNPEPPVAAPTYTAGYRRPPVHGQFKPGHTKCGGRPKGQRNARTAFQEILNEKITLREGKRTRSLSKRDAMYLRITNDAVSGNAKSQSNVIALMRSYGMFEEPQEATKQEPFTTDDGALIADFFQRHGHEMEPTQPAEGTAKPQTGEAKPPIKDSKETKS
jgi:hypothetical protein